MGRTTRTASTEEVAAWAAENGLTMPAVHESDLTWVWYETPEWASGRPYKGWVPEELLIRPYDNVPGFEVIEVSEDEWEERYFFVYDIGLCFAVFEGHNNYQDQLYYVQRVETGDEAAHALLMKPWNETCEEIAELLEEFGDSEE